MSFGKVGSSISGTRRFILVYELVIGHELVKYRIGHLKQITYQILQLFYLQLNNFRIQASIKVFIGDESNSC